MDSLLNVHNSFWFKCQTNHYLYGCNTALITIIMMMIISPTNLIFILRNSLSRDTKRWLVAQHRKLLL